jgi:signal transduction histidine kinase/CheY-like chemotaxis protein
MFKLIKRKHDLWVLLICLLLSAAASVFYYCEMQRQAVGNIEHIRTIYADRTRNVINAVFHKTDVLAAVVKLENGHISYRTFNEIAKLVYEKDHGIRGIQFMPRAVVTFSYPVKGNEAVIGKDFLRIPKRLKDVRLAIDTRSIALSGPYHLIQGGLGLVARNPVFLTDEFGKEYFWGFSTIVLDLPQALKNVGFENLRREKFDYQLFSINENNERIVIDGNPDLDIKKSVCGAVSVPHHQWMFAIKRQDTWVDVVKALLMMLACTMLSLIVWLLYTLMRQNEAVNMAKDSFFSDISHDMRTPLNAVIGFSSMAQKKGLSAADKDAYLAKIQTSGMLLLDLINDTLTLSKMNSGKMELHKEPVTTDLLEKSILDPVRIMAERSGVTLVWDNSGCRHRTVLADRLSVEKIFLNIINNAIKFTPAGGHIWVTLKEDPAGAKDADIITTVKDEGIGMSSEFLPHIFEPFSQERRGGYERSGTGLGLSIAKHLVDLMGGTISVKSEAGHGSEFTVRINYKDAPAAQPKNDKTEEKEEAFDFTGKKVLLCEDNGLNREIAVELLREKGIETVAAENGQEGVDLFAASKLYEYAAVLMDIRMPVMDGYEATKEIRALPRADAGAVPIIAMTANAYAEDVQKCLDCGMNAHVAKPIDIRTLFAALRKFMK